MRRILFALLLAAALAVPASAEVWNDPGGRTVMDTSVTVTFPRAFTDVLVSNDDESGSVYVRLFWCNETAAAATTDSIEIKGTKNRSFTYYAGERGNLSKPGYCAIAIIGPSTPGAAIRIEGK